MPTTKALRRNTENWDDDFEVESCLRRDGGMCERRAGTTSWSRRRNATSWTTMPSLGVEMRKMGRSLLVFLRHHRLCLSFRLITIIRRLNVSLVLQWPVCFPSRIPLIPIGHRLPLFTDLRYFPSPLIHKEREVKEEESSTPRRQESSSKIGDAYIGCVFCG
jgi:hypothetical protein